jgi:hypothetical protein
MERKEEERKKDQQLSVVSYAKGKKEVANVKDDLAIGRG